MIEEKIIGQESNEVLSQKIIPRSATSVTTPRSTNHQNSALPSTTGKTKIFPVIEGIQSPKTRDCYQRCFDHFLDHIQIHDLQVLLDFSSKVIKQMLVDYVIYLRDEKPGKKLSRSSIRTHLVAILHFFQINNDDFNLTTRNFKIYLPSNDSIIEDRPYFKEEIRQVLNECDIRSRIIILLLTSSGMRMGALHSLRISDLTKIDLEKSILYKIQIYAGTRDKYFSFCTPECYSAIQNYLDYRKRSGEVITDKSPLIREQFNVDDHIRIQYPKFMSEKGIEHIIYNVLVRSGIRKPREIHQSHGFRKFFMSECEKSGMKSINVKLILGHDIGVSGHYYRPTESDLLQDYITYAVDALTIDPNQRLKARVQQLESQQTQEIVQLRGAQDELERRMFLVMSEMRKFKTRHKEWKTENRQLEYKKNIRTEGLEG